MNTILGKPAMTTTEIGRKLGFMVPASLIEEIGMPPDEQTANCSMWYEYKFPSICYALSQHIFGKMQDHHELREEIQKKAG